jgi:hypothetical protein
VRSPHPRTKGLEEIDHGKEETCKESPEKKGQVTPRSKVLLKQAPQFTAAPFLFRIAVKERRIQLLVEVTGGNPFSSS